MSITLPNELTAQSREDKALLSPSWVIVALLGVPVVLAGMAAALPWGLVLPVFASIAVTAGFLLAAVAYVRSAGSASPPGRILDVAAGLVFLGFAASIIADGDELLKALAGS